MNRFNKKWLSRFQTAVAFLVALTYSFDAEGSKTWHDVSVKPNDKKLVAIPIDGPYYGGLRIWPSGGKLICSGITIQDSALWTPDGKTEKVHTYRISNAYSGQEFVSITGLVTTVGPGERKPPPFQVTVPEVDVDWVEYTGWNDENGEDTRIVYLANDVRKAFIVREPADEE